MQFVTSVAQKNKMVWLALLLCAAFAAAQGTASAQANADLALEKIFVTQAVYDEPLILNKDTIVRAVINAPQAMDAQVTVQFDGKEFKETKALKAGTNNVCGRAAKFSHADGHCARGPGGRGARPESVQQYAIRDSADGETE